MRPHRPPFQKGKPSVAVTRAFHSSLSLSLFGHLPSRNLCFVALETMREGVFSELRDQDTMDEVFKFFKWGLDKKVCDGEE